MTVIVAVSDGARVCMACDSQATSSNGSTLTIANPKIARVGGCLIGADGSFAISQFAQYRFTPNGWGGMSLIGIANDFVDVLRPWLKERDLMRSVDGKQELPGNIIIARKSEFVLIDGGGSLVWLAQSWWAVGSGAPEARGALFILQRAEHCEADLMARDAVDAAIAHDDGCGGPVRIEWTDP